MFLKLGGNYEFNNSIYAHQPFSSHVVSPSTPDRPSFPSPTQMLSSGTIIASIILTKRQRNPKYHNHGISPFFLIVLCQVRLGTTLGAVLLKDALQRASPPHKSSNNQYIAVPRLSVDRRLRLGTGWEPPIRGSEMFERPPRPNLTDFFSVFSKKHLAHPFPTWTFFGRVHKIFLPPQIGHFLGAPTLSKN